MIGWRILLWAVLVLAALLFLYLVRGILPPFIIAFVIASLLDPSIRKLRLRGVSRKWAVSLVFVVFFAGVAAFGVLVGPRIGQQVNDLTATITDLTGSLSKVDENTNFFRSWNPVVQANRRNRPSQIDRILQPYEGALERFGIPTTQRAIVQQYLEPNRAQITVLVKRGFEAFFGALRSLPAQILNIILIPILVFMILMDMEDFKRRTPRWIPPTLRPGAMRLFGDIGDVFMRYLRGVTTVVLLFTFAVVLLFLAMGVPYAILIGLVFGALYLIPYIGNILSCVILFTLVGFSGATGNHFFSLASPWAYATLVTVMFLAVGFVFDHLVYPQMVGSSVGLNGVVSMFVILCGGALFGLPGMILAFPLAGAAKVVLDRLIKVTSTSSEELDLPVVPLRHRTNPAT